MGLDKKLSQLMACMLIYETHVEETKWCHVYLQVLKEEFEDTNQNP
jgi:hypothetical protein